MATIKISEHDQHLSSSEKVNTQAILTLLEERIAGAIRNERTAEQQWMDARTDIERAVAHNAQQISIGQRLVLQGIFDEIQSYQPTTSLDRLPLALSLEEGELYRVVKWWYQEYQGTSKEAVATLAFFLLEQRSLHPRGIYATLRDRLARRTDSEVFQGALYEFLSDLVEQST